MITYFGDYAHSKFIIDNGQPDLEIRFRLPSRIVPDLHGRYGEIVARLNNFLGILDINAENRVVMTINELVSNALKYRIDTTKIYVKIALYHGNLVVEVHNTVDTATHNEFFQFITLVLAGDLDVLYFKRIQYLIDNSDAEKGQLGIVTIMRECMARLGYCCDDLEDGTKRIVAYACLEMGPKHEA